MPEFERHRPARCTPVDRFNETTVLFVTVCTRNRGSLLDNSDSQHALVSAWFGSREWQVAEYMIMPDHVHLFCMKGVPAPEPIRSWCRYWKSSLSRSFPKMKGIWQDDIWDRQIRSPDHLVEKRHYMRMNPVRAGLVERSADWPFQGTLADIAW